MEFLGYVEAETPRAWLFRGHFWDKALWLPKSRVFITRNFDNDEVKVWVPVWFCVKNQLKEI